jgi:ATP-dependent RNA helicase DeaD
MQDDAGPRRALGPEIVRALEAKGYLTLTPVQRAVLDPELTGRDLRITSQTGSGKTVAVGFVISDAVLEPTESHEGAARPRVLFITPTRELAQQVERELSWLFAFTSAKVTSVTGGASYRDEHRALAAGPTVVVGTPGRLLDHLGRKTIDASSLAALVLDEADRMLDMGFREDLDEILEHVPAARRTHLMSATFPRDVRALADRVQDAPARVEGTVLGAANADIEHVIHLVDDEQRFDAMVNILLADPDARTLVFARTRIDVSRLARELSDLGFSTASLSGEMEQRARNRALAAFRRGDLKTLVATDVAARGIDVTDITQVIHMDPPTDADTYVHRSGRTGRAGKKGTSSLLVDPRGRRRVVSLLEHARLTFRYAPVPSPGDILEKRDARLLGELLEDDPASYAGLDPRSWAMAERIVAAESAVPAVTRLLMRSGHAGPTQPREVRPIAVPTERAAGTREARAAGPKRPTRSPSDWVHFRVSWGEARGADARRLLAMVCRRGGIGSGDVGAIKIGRHWSIIEIGKDVATKFGEAAARPDPRDPRTEIRPERPAGGAKERGFTPRERPPSPRGRPFAQKERPAGAKERPVGAKERPAGAKERPVGAKERPPSTWERPAPEEARGPRPTSGGRAPARRPPKAVPPHVRGRDKPKAR